MRMLLNVTWMGLIGWTLIFTGCMAIKQGFVWTHDAIDEAGGISNIVDVVDGTNDTPDTTPIAEPIIGDHGTPRLVRSPDGGDEWAQYEDGYWHKGDGPSGFVTCLHLYSLPGIGIVCKAAGGRDCGRAAITNVSCKVASRSPHALSEGGTWDECPNSVEWTVQLEGGFNVYFQHSHTADVMSRGTVHDLVKGIKADFGCNGFRTGNGRGYDTVKDAQGREWPTGIRMVKPGIARQR